MGTLEIPETPTIQVPEVLMGLILVHLAHDRNHKDQNVAYVAVRLDNACRDLLRAEGTGRHPPDRRGRPQPGQI
jgi:hypothetical protein